MNTTLIFPGEITDGPATLCGDGDPRQVTVKCTVNAGQCFLSIEDSAAVTVGSQTEIGLGQTEKPTRPSAFPQVPKAGDATMTVRADPNGFVKAGWTTLYAEVSGMRMMNSRISQYVKEKLAGKNMKLTMEPCEGSYSWSRDLILEKYANVNGRYLLDFVRKVGLESPASARVMMVHFGIIAA